MLQSYFYISLYPVIILYWGTLQTEWPDEIKIKKCKQCNVQTAIKFLFILSCAFDRIRNASDASAKRSPVHTLLSCQKHIILGYLSKDTYRIATRCLIDAKSRQIKSQQRNAKDWPQVWTQRLQQRDLYFIFDTSCIPCGHLRKMAESISN